MAEMVAVAEVVAVAVGAGVGVAEVADFAAAVAAWRAAVGVWLWRSLITDGPLDHHGRSILETIALIVEMADARPHHRRVEGALTPRYHQRGSTTGPCRGNACSIRSGRGSDLI